MVRKLLFGTTAAVAIFGAPEMGVAGPSSLPTHTEFQFTGLCSDCFSGAGSAHAQLVVQNYVLGNSFSISNFVSFAYDGTDLQSPFTITSGNIANFSGSIGPGLPGEYDVDIFGGDNGSLQ